MCQAFFLGNGDYTFQLCKKSCTSCFDQLQNVPEGHTFMNTLLAQYNGQYLLCNIELCKQSGSTGLQLRCVEQMNLLFILSIPFMRNFADLVGENKHPKSVERGHCSTVCNTGVKSYESPGKYSLHTHTLHLSQSGSHC